MYRFLTALAALVMMGTAPGAVAAAERYQAFAENRGWTVSYDRQDKVCVAAPKGDEGGLFLVRPNSGSIVVLIASDKLSWLTNEHDYDVVIHTDRKRWTGTMRANVSDGSGGLYLADPNVSFMSALRGAGRLTINVENVSYGPFSLAGSNEAIRQVADCARALERGDFAPPEPEAADTGVMIEWTRADFGKSYRAEDWTLTLSAEDGTDGEAVAVLSVVHKDGGEATLRLETGSEDMGRGQFGIYPLDWGGSGVVFSSFSGGAHCCTSVSLAYRADKEVRAIELGTFDGFGIAPADLDDDERVEFEMQDERFLYAFSSYAESVAPVKIMALRDGEVRDLTGEGAFRPVVERRFEASMRNCLTDSNPGACAGALGNAGLLGWYPAALNLMALAQIDTAMEENYLACDDADTCKGRAPFKGFAEAAGWRLDRWGYATGSTLDERAETLLAELAATKEGYGPADGGEEREDRCGMGALTFEVDREKKTASLHGYEYGCTIGQAVVMRDALVADLLCTGEGDFWLDRTLYERDGQDLLALPLKGGITAGSVGSYKACAPEKSEPAKTNP